MARPDTEDTPIEIPRAAAPSSPVFEPVAEGSNEPNDETRVVRNSLIGLTADLIAADEVASASADQPAPPDPEELLKRALGSLLGESGGGGGGPSGPVQIQKGLKKNAWALTLVIALFGTGGPIAGYYAIKSLAESNADAIKEHMELPAHPEATKQIESIDRSIKATSAAVDHIKTEQTAIVDGIDQLKKEAQTEKQKRLQTELEEARRKLREERRRRR